MTAVPQSFAGSVWLQRNLQACDANSTEFCPASDLLVYDSLSPTDVNVQLAGDNRTAQVTGSSVSVLLRPDDALYPLRHQTKMGGCLPDLHGGASCSTTFEPPVLPNDSREQITPGDAANAVPALTPVLNSAYVGIGPFGVNYSPGWSNISMSGHVVQAEVFTGNANVTLHGSDAYVEAFQTAHVDVSGVTDFVDASIVDGSYIGSPGVDDINAMTASVDTGAGDDLIETRGSYTNAGPGTDRIVLLGQDPQTVDCGPGDDTVTNATPEDTLINCEHVSYR